MCKLKNRYFAFVMAFILSFTVLISIFSASTVALAAGNTVWTRFPKKLQAYPISTGYTTVYQSTSTSSSVIGKFDGLDPVTINEVYTDGWASITYQLTAGGSKTGYCNFDQAFLPQNLITWGGSSLAKVSGSQTVYRRYDCKDKFGTVTSDDPITLLGSVGSKSLIIYSLDSGSYKMGWVTGTVNTSIYNKVKAYTLATGTTSTSLGSISGANEIVISNFYYGAPSFSVSSGGVSKGTCNSSAFLSYNIDYEYSRYIYSQKNVYRRANTTNYYGYVTAEDPILVVGVSGGWQQIIYQLDSGGFKMGWIQA